MSRKRRFVKWAGPRVTLFAVLIVVFLILEHVTVTHREDGWLLGMIAGTALFAALVLIFWPFGWSLTDAGQTSIYVAEASLYGAAFISYEGWRHGLSSTDANWVRSAFIVGGLALDVGLTLRIVSVWRERTRDG